VLDNPKRALDLITAMKSAIPFEVELTPSLLAHLRFEARVDDIAPRQVVRDVSYAGDDGGVLCHLEPAGMRNRALVSLTHVRTGRTLSFAAEASAYQKHRIKKLKKQRPQRLA
jgi:hypothetical protein